MSEVPSPPLPPQGGGGEGGKGGGADAKAAAGRQASPQGEEKEEAGSTFYEAKHVAFITGLMDKTDSFEHVVMEHLKMSAVYWALMGMALMGRDLEAEMKLSEIVEWVLLCQHPNGGFGGNTGHDPHLLYTLSAIQILAIAGQLQKIDQEKVAEYVLGLQQPDGSFTGDEWGEVDTRFSYCALSTLALLGRLSMADLPKAKAYVGSCRNFDGGFGCVPGAESHAGQIFTCVGALAMGEGGRDHVDEELLGWWLCERQCDSGGLNGRPEKQADVCYSWWILSALSILGKIDWIDRARLKSFILACQDTDDGGISDRPGNMADVFHTFFGIAGLALLHYFEDEGGKEGGKYAQYRAIDPVFALPVDVVEALGLRSELLGKR